VNEQFHKDAKQTGFNMAVCMFMVDAMQYFHNVHSDRIKWIAHEIARMGTAGIQPNHKNYTVKLIPHKIFSGYHLLAYYYVSWAISIPEMLEDLKLPYKDEYKMALTLYQKK